LKRTKIVVTPRAEANIYELIEIVLQEEKEKGKERERG